MATVATGLWTHLNSGKYLHTHKNGLVSWPQPSAYIMGYTIVGAGLYYSLLKVFFDRF